MFKRSFGSLGFSRGMSGHHRGGSFLTWEDRSQNSSDKGVLNGSVVCEAQVCKSLKPLSCTAKPPIFADAVSGRSWLAQPQARCCKIYPDEDPHRCRLACCLA